MSIILDLDLDLFVSPTARDVAPGSGRLPSEEYMCVSEETVRQFLELRCGLSTSPKLRGREVTSHDEAFVIWRDWLSRAEISNPFTVVHADAHADLGQTTWGHTEDTDWSYILTELLSHPVRNRPELSLASGRLNPGNYLAFSIACEWIDDLTLVYPGEADQGSPPFPVFDGAPFPSDFIPEFFADCDPDSERMSLCRFDADDRSNLEHGKAAVPNEEVVSLPFRRKWSYEYQGTGFTHLVLSRSPDFTPVEADVLIPVIQRYFEPI